MKKRFNYPLDLQLFAEQDPAADNPEETDETQTSEKTVSKALYDQKVRELSKANKRLKELEGKDTDAATKDARITELEKEVEVQKVNNQLITKLTSMGCTDIDYALYRIHQNNPDLKLDEDGKLGNINDLTSAVKTSNPSVFAGKEEIEVQVERLDSSKNHESEMTKEAFLKKSYNERNAYAMDHPEEFKKLMKE